LLFWLLFYVGFISGAGGLLSIAKQAEQCNRSSRNLLSCFSLAQHPYIRISYFRIFFEISPTADAESR